MLKWLPDNGSSERMSEISADARDLLSQKHQGAFKNFG